MLIEKLSIYCDMSSHDTTVDDLLCAAQQVNSDFLATSIQGEETPYGGPLGYDALVTDLITEMEAKPNWNPQSSDLMRDLLDPSKYHAFAGMKVLDVARERRKIQA